MKNLEIFCICINNNLLEKVNLLNYTPVGLRYHDYSPSWVRDNSGNNISSKNKFYGEYTFHYWLWKNKLKDIDENKWIGFCSYRRFWENKEQKINPITNFKNQILDHVPEKWNNYEVILGKPMNLENVKWTKVIKYGKLALTRNPMAIFKRGRTIRWQFDMAHGCGNMDKAINVLNKNDREDFRRFVKNNTSYNQGNMFICKSKKIMNNYYEAVFEWLKKCEDLFGFNLEGYGNIRIYAFLAERFLPFWFNKYTKVLEWPIMFHDLNNENIQ